MSGLNLTQFKYQVIEPALNVIGLNTLAALNLVLGTAIAESNASDLVQINGPALGLFQIEPNTETDVWTNFLAYNQTMANQVQSMLAPGNTTQQLIWNLSYGAAICRIIYWRSPVSLPAYNDASGMSTIHKNVYNTAAGAANIQTDIPLFQQAINA